MSRIRPSFAVAWQSPCASHTCRHRDHHHHHQNWQCIGRWPTKWSDFFSRPLWGPHPLDVDCAGGPSLKVLYNQTLIPKYFKRGSTSAMLWKRPKVHHGKSLQPPTPSLSTSGPKNIATTVDENLLEMGSWCHYWDYWDSTNNFSKRLSQSELL